MCPFQETDATFDTGMPMTIFHKPGIVSMF